MHGGRAAYYVMGEGVLPETPAQPAGRPAGGQPLSVPGLKFGRMFGKTGCALSPEERAATVKRLIRLGLCMNDLKTCGGQPADAPSPESDIPAGYTYLGQFIAHEVTRDSTGEVLVPELDFNNLRTPQIDLDSLYGGGNGPDDRPDLYDKNGAYRKKDGTYVKAAGLYLRTNKVAQANNLKTPFPNDLPRGADNKPRKAIIGDPRNDENLALAQTHLAFIHFHNRVVDAVWAADESLPARRVFESAREQVIRHFQWVILHDFLPNLVMKDVLDCVVNHGLRWFRGDGEDGLFMPLEFSAAAFRIGHTMVRAVYDWNPYRRTTTDFKTNGPVLLPDLFTQTGNIKDEFSGFDKGTDNLKADWVIDWRHFYDFCDLVASGQVVAVADHNKASRLDTVFDLHLDQVRGFDDDKIEEMQKALTVRNLLRGFYLGLPTGEEVADWIGEKPLTRKQVADGPHEAVLDHPLFWGRTPLWYYVLKEAELLGVNEKGEPGNRLGPVGSRIVAETLVCLIKHSPYSILEGPAWYPAYGRGAGKDAVFGMVDLLKFAGVVDPIAENMRRLGHNNTGG